LIRATGWATSIVVNPAAAVLEQSPPFGQRCAGIPAWPSHAFHAVGGSADLDGERRVVFSLRLRPVQGRSDGPAVRCTAVLPVKALVQWRDVAKAANIEIEPGQCGR
jgi:hypothetical protein